jgi:hydrogenase expression/formation protein HypE
VVIAVRDIDSEKVIKAMRTHQHGREARIIGRVSSDDRARVILRSSFNTRRIMFPPAGELLPRIC